MEREGERERGREGGERERETVLEERRGAKCWGERERVCVCEGRERERERELEREGQ